MWGSSAVEGEEGLKHIDIGGKEYTEYVMYGNEHKQKPALPSRLKALELLGKHHKLFTDQVKVTGDLGVQIVDDIPEA